MLKNSWGNYYFLIQFLNYIHLENWI
jgi:hypothetical protein